ncbi:DUF1176 domain-containing protein [Sphingomonas sp. XXL09]|uniref:DUF1176 domain-containing protein n=1 Tax=Sphingomonas sp. XXL09 TaxID=3457787 RepID=UPI00406BAB47
MTRAAPIALLLLAACSRAPQHDRQSAPSPTARPAPAATAAAATADSKVTPRPGALKTFGDWTVGCDNGLACTMASLLPDTGFGSGPTLALTRDAGPAGRYHADLGEGATDAQPRPAAPRFTIDGRDLGADADALAAAMVNGRQLRLPGGTVSLKGASAALRYIDAAQHRAGTTSATVARGPASAVPPAPALPLVVAQPLIPSKATLPAAVIATMNRIARCELGDGIDATPDVAAAPDGRLLVVLPCSAGAYNVIGALFVVAGSTVTPAAVDAAVGFDATGADSETPVHSVINGSFDGNLLTSYAKGRGLGDCGSAQRLAWDGRRYRLVEQSDMGECRGNPNFITTWRARVLTR